MRNSSVSLKGVLSTVLVPITKWYLRRDRVVHSEGLTLRVPTGVFHPTLFPSTGMLLDYLADEDLQGKTVLELGCGSGLLALRAAQAGASVTAVDINPAAVEATLHNAMSNDIDLEVLQSDLFGALSGRTFDWILINPPYYRRPAADMTARAWNCGENFEYFTNLFASLGPHLLPHTTVLMTLTAAAEVKAITTMAYAHGYRMELLIDQYSWIDGRDYLFRVWRSPV